MVHDSERQGMQVVEIVSTSRKGLPFLNACGGDWMMRNPSCVSVELDNKLEL